MHYLGLRHKHERDVAQGGEVAAQRHSTTYKKWLDKITFVVGAIGPFTVVPQIYQIYSTQQASGVSLETWSLMFVVTLPWVFYGLAHKERSITVSFFLWEVMNALVVIGVLLYGG